MKAAAALYHSGKKSLDQADHDENHFQHDLQAPDAIGYCQRLACPTACQFQNPSKQEINHPPCSPTLTQNKILPPFQKE